MALARSKVTAQGQISVPAGIRKRLGITPGSILEWEEEGEKIVVRRAGRYSSEDIHRALFPNGPPDWGYCGPGGAKGGASASPTTPGFEAEFGGGWFDPWGGAPWSGQGYAFERTVDGPAYERQFYLTNVANGIKLQNVYMTFGGTSWGWLPAPLVYTSYDYGAAISEARQLTAKIPAMKEMGYFLAAVTDVAQLAKAAAVAASNTSVKTYHLTNPATGTHFYFVRNDQTSNLTFTLPVATPDGSYTVPQTGTMALNGKDMKVLVAAYSMDSAHLVYTTSHLMTHAPVGAQDIALLVSRPREHRETGQRHQ